MSRLTSKNGKHWSHDKIIFVCIFNNIRIISFDYNTNTPLLNLMLLWIYFWQNIIEMKTKISLFAIASYVFFLFLCLFFAFRYIKIAIASQSHRIEPNQVKSCFFHPESLATEWNTEQISFFSLSQTAFDFTITIGNLQSAKVFLVFF